MIRKRGEFCVKITDSLRFEMLLVDKKLDKSQLFWTIFQSKFQVGKNGILIFKGHFCQVVNKNAKFYFAVSKWQ